MGQNCPDCNSACLSKTSDACVLWSGISIPALGIKKGDYYNDAIVAFASKFVELSEGLIDVSSTNDGTCDNCSDKLPLFQAVQRMSNKLANLKSSDIRVDSNFTGLADNGLSADAGKLLNRSATYSVASLSTGSSVSFDLTNAISNLPLDYQLAKTNVTLTGKRKFGSSVIVDSSLPTFAANVSNDRYPLNAEVTVRINTPNGTVDLVDNILIDSPRDYSGTFILSVKDRSKTAGETISLNEMVDIMSSQLRQNKSELDQLNNLAIQGYSNVPLPSTKASNVISTVVSKLSKVIDDTNNLSSVNYDNSGNLVKGTPAEVIALIATNINSIKTDIRNIITDIKNINDSLSNLSQSNITLLSQGGGATTGSSTGGSGSGSGGCPGGNCG